MTDENPPLPPAFTPPSPRLPTDARLEQYLSGLLREACLPEVWLLLLDASQRLIEPLVQIDELPREEDGIEDISRAGGASFGEVIVRQARFAAQVIGARAFVFVWERQGSDRLTPMDRAFARSALQAASQAGEPGSEDVGLRAQFVLHSGGLRQITVDDLI